MCIHILVFKLFQIIIISELIKKSELNYLPKGRLKIKNGKPKQPKHATHLDGKRTGGHEQLGRHFGERGAFAEAVLPSREARLRR